MKEEWREIKEFNNFEVSNTGKIRSKKYKKVLKTTMKCSNTLTVILRYKDSNGKTKSTSRCVGKLVYETFMGDIDTRYFINHKDGDEYNNNLDNLELIKKGKESNLKNRKMGIERNDSKLNNEKVISILMLDYLSIKLCLESWPSKMAKIYKVDRGTIMMIAYKKRWVHIKLSKEDIEYCNSLIDKYYGKCYTVDDAISEVMEYKKITKSS